MSIFGGVIWHYWLAVPLVVVGVVSLIAALVGYAEALLAFLRGCSALI